jgi:phage shock protein C
MEKRLTLSNDKYLCGVCGGIAEHINCDPTIIRLTWALALFTPLPAIITYLVCALVIPAKEKENEEKTE